MLFIALRLTDAEIFSFEARGSIFLGDTLYYMSIHTHLIIHGIAVRQLFASVGLCPALRITRRSDMLYWLPATADTVKT